MDARLLANAPAAMAEQYERGMVPIIFAPCAALLIAQAQPRPGERVLDIACGTGVVTRLVAERVGPSGTVVGLDVSPAMLAVARRETAGLPITWREADATALPFDDASFDLVLCQQGLQFFPDRVGALREMRRVLAPDGRLGLALWARQEENPVVAALGDALARHVGPQARAMPPYMLGDADVVRGLVAEAGFGEIAVRQEPMPTRWPTVAEFVNRFAAGAGPMLAALAALPAEERHVLMDEMCAALAPYTSDAGLVAPYPTILTIARP